MFFKPPRGLDMLLQQDVNLLRRGVNLLQRRVNLQTTNLLTKFMKQLFGNV